MPRFSPTVIADTKSSYLLSRQSRLPVTFVFVDGDGDALNLAHICTDAKPSAVGSTQAWRSSTPFVGFCGCRATYRACCRALLCTPARVLLRTSRRTRDLTRQGAKARTSLRAAGRTLARAGARTPLRTLERTV